MGPIGFVLQVADTTRFNRRCYYRERFANYSCVGRGIFTLAGQMVRCETRGKGRYGRWIATCFAGTVDIGENVVFTGWALAYEGEDRADYIRREVAAKFPS